MDKILIILYFIISFVYCYYMKQEFIKVGEETADRKLYKSDWIIAYCICCFWPVLISLDFIEHIKKEIK